MKYFTAIKRELRLPEVNILPIGTGYSTGTLVDYALSQCDASDDLVECWVVFDRDEHVGYNEAIEKGRANNINVAFSNESFELWYVLHFDYLQTALGRDKLNEKLTKLIGRRYEKNMDIYSIIKDREPEAIKNAKKLEKMHDANGINSFQNRAPSTTVFELVERLRKIKK
ncbi:RloB domain-containing protein [candidate division WWE3 bacterium]|uniref:RloB domain-containing protein n=1 Tax=candidate division WWE3 bacterium TaxID=2053526 RepID=A0A955RWR3_UNCKA|nr:RloB domain-containing protein [candidate division WWE3 bacterium]